MGVEIERKFLVTTDIWRVHVCEPGRLLRQGYLVSGPPLTVRVRISESEAWLTLKGLVVGLSRSEFEYSIPLSDAEEMLASYAVSAVVEKIRYRIAFGNLVIEVDEFRGDNDGLIVAEVEFPDEDTPFSPPDWFAREVTEDSRYSNSQLAMYPFSKWNN